jgi:hypothetical protein
MDACITQGSGGTKPPKLYFGSKNLTLPFKMNQNKWALRKEITVGDILIMLTVVVPILWIVAQDHFKIVEHDDTLKSQQITLNDHSIKIGELSVLVKGAGK